MSEPAAPRTKRPRRTSRRDGDAAPKKPSPKAAKAAPSPDDLAWQRVGDDIVGSIRAFEVSVPPFQYRSDAAQVEREVLAGLPAAKVMFASYEPNHDAKCMCRHYCLLRAMSTIAAQARDMCPVRAYENALAKFDRYMENRS